MAVQKILMVIAVIMMINFASANCPPKEKVFNREPVCYTNADCLKWGKVCCPNQFNTKSCAYRAPNSSYGNGGSSVYCSGIKCKPGQTCKLDRRTNKKKCLY